MRSAFDWPHVALFLLTALCIAGLIFFATKTGNTALVGVGVTAAGAFVTSLLAMLRGSVTSQTLTAMRAYANHRASSADATTPVEVPRVPPGRNE